MASGWNSPGIEKQGGEVDEDLVLIGELLQDGGNILGRGLVKNVGSEDAEQFEDVEEGVAVRVAEGGIALGCVEAEKSMEVANEVDEGVQFSLLLLGFPHVASSHGWDKNR